LESRRMYYAREGIQAPNVIQKFAKGHMKERGKKRGSSLKNPILENGEEVTTNCVTGWFTVTAHRTKKEFWKKERQIRSVYLSKVKKVGAMF